MIFDRLMLRFLKLLENQKNKIVLHNFISTLKSSGNNIVIEFPFDFMNSSCISIGNQFVARKNMKIRAFKEFGNFSFDPEIIIGNNVSIETDCHIGCINKVIIGNNVLIASGVYINDHFHGLPDYSDIDIPPLSRKLFSKGPIIIHDNVWIGERAVILPGVIIGRNSIIGANAVVTKNIPEYCIAVGVPAEVIKWLK